MWPLLLQNEINNRLKLLTVAWCYTRVLKQTRSTSFTAYREKDRETTLVVRRNGLILQPITDRILTSIGFVPALFLASVCKRTCVTFIALAKLLVVAVFHRWLERLRGGGLLRRSQLWRARRSESTGIWIEATRYMRVSSSCCFRVSCFHHEESHRRMKSMMKIQSSAGQAHLYRHA